MPGKLVVMLRSLRVFLDPSHPMPIHRQLPLLLALTVCACGGDNEATAPLAPGGNGNTRIGPTGRDGGGTPIDGDGDGDQAGDGDGSDDEDGGVAFAETMLACERVEEAPFTGEGPAPGSPVNNAIEVPDDFSVTRVASGFRGTCDEPKLALVFSGGRCPDGDGHELLIELDVAAIESGLFVGQYRLGEIGDAPRGANIRYRRPDGRRPMGEWGTCGEEVSGTLEFTSQGGLNRRDEYQGRYNLSLPACDESAEQPTQIVRGTFSLKLETGLETVCPAE